MRFPDAIEAANEEINKGPQEMTIGDSLREIGVGEFEAEGLIAAIVQNAGVPREKVCLETLEALGFTLYIGLMVGREMAGR